MSRYDSIKSIYSYLKSIPDMNNFYKLKIPFSEHQELLKEQNINITNLNKNNRSNRIYKSIIVSASKYIIPYIIENHVLVKLMDYINSIKNMPQEILNEIISYYTNGIKITNNIHYKKIKEQYNKIQTNINQTFIDLLIKIFENKYTFEVKFKLYS